MQILRPGAGVPACLLQLTGLLGPTLEPGNSSCLCVHAANSPPWGFGWALGWVLCTCGPRMFEAPPPKRRGTCCNPSRYLLLVAMRSAAAAPGRRKR